MIIACILAIVEWINATLGLMLLWLAYAYEVPGLLLPAVALCGLAITARGYALLRSNGAAVERVFGSPSEDAERGPWSALNEQSEVRP